jgi:GNAT superfamily N-acetyltransferase
MRASPVRFRSAVSADSAQIAALHAHSWRQTYRGMLPDAYLDGELDAERAQFWHARMMTSSDRRFVLLAEQGQTLVGFVCVLLDEEPAWGACLDNLHVQPGRIGQGFGGQLLLQSARWVAATEPTWPMHLWVIEDNIRARRFYERYGGQAVERVVKTLPGGGTPVALRYVWHDLTYLLNNRALVQ